MNEDNINPYVAADPEYYKHKFLELHEWLEKRYETFSQTCDIEECDEDVRAEQRQLGGADAFYRTLCWIRGHVSLPPEENQK